MFLYRHNFICSQSTLIIVKISMTQYVHKAPKWHAWQILPGFNSVKADEERERWPTEPSAEDSVDKGSKSPIQRKYWQLPPRKTRGGLLYCSCQTPSSPILLSRILVLFCPRSCLQICFLQETGLPLFSFICQNRWPPS